MKVGYLGTLFTDDRTWFTNNQNLTFRFNNGVPNQLTQSISPWVNNARAAWHALYAQEQWTLGRLTLQGALRFDHAASWFPRRRVTSASGVTSIEHDFVGVREHASGNVSRTAHAGELRDLVVQRFQVLDVDGREHVDVGVQQVARCPRSAWRARRPARWCARARRPGTARGAHEDAGQVHLLELVPPVVDRSSGDLLQALRHRRGLVAAVGLEDADDDVASGLGLGLALLQHAVGLADARRHAEEDLVAARPPRADATRPAAFTES